MTLFSLAGSPDHASRTAAPGSDLERKMTGTSGRKCLEQFEKFNRAGLCARTFAALLIGTEGWYSTKCRLIWKLRATKCSRFYFQLVPSILLIDGIGFGLLPTVTKVQQDHPERVEALKATGAKTMQRRNCGENRPNSILDAVNFYGMLPTPIKSEAIERRNMKTVVRIVETGSNQATLTTMAKYGNLLPTPAKLDGKTGYMGANRDGKQINVETFIRNKTGSTSQLNPRFVEEMMGFPEGWTELPFQSGENSASEPTETPSSPK